MRGSEPAENRDHNRDHKNDHDEPDQNVEGSGQHGGKKQIHFTTSSQVKTGSVGRGGNEALTASTAR